MKYVFKWSSTKSLTKHFLCSCSSRDFICSCPQTAVLYLWASTFQLWNLNLDFGQSFEPVLPENSSSLPAHWLRHSSSSKIYRCHPLTCLIAKQSILVQTEKLSSSSHSAGPSNTSTRRLWSRWEHGFLSDGHPSPFSPDTPKHLFHLLAQVSNAQGLIKDENGKGGHSEELMMTKPPVFSTFLQMAFRLCVPSPQLTEH